VRHRRPRAGFTHSVTRLAEEWWRLPLIFAAALFALSGPAHAFGRVNTVFYATLGGVTLGGIGVALGVLAAAPTRVRKDAARTRDAATGVGGAGADDMDQELRGRASA
jgi:hypothetical protein